MMETSLKLSLFLFGAAACVHPRGALSYLCAALRNVNVTAGDPEDDFPAPFITDNSTTDFMTDSAIDFDIHSMTINPASMLPMATEFIDIAGNPMWQDLSTQWDD